ASARNDQAVIGGRVNIVERRICLHDVAGTFVVAKDRPLFWVCHDRLRIVHHSLEGLLRRGCNGHVVAFLHHAETPVIQLTAAAAAIPDDNQNACSFALHFLLHGSAADIVDQYLTAQTGSGSNESWSRVSPAGWLCDPYGFWWFSFSMAFRVGMR